MILVFCVALSLLLAQVNGQISLEQRNHEVYGDKNKLVPSLSRKLKLNQEEITAKTFTDKDLLTEKLLEDSSGAKLVEENEENGKRTAEKNVEDLSMDYHPVRRRRPIHNKQIPFGP